MPKGYLNIVLHAHLPYVRHPESEEYIEERWLFEAISETYIPLLIYFDKLEKENVHFRITMNISAPLITMLKDPLLQGRYRMYLLERIRLAGKEIKRTRDNKPLNDLAKMYKRKYNSDLVEGFKHFQDIGVLEIIACPATHGFLPLLYVNPSAVNAQIATGVDVYKKAFGRAPRGMWLSECAYIPELEPYLRKYGICRICFRELAYKGQIPGVRKASW